MVVDVKTPGFGGHKEKISKPFSRDPY